MQILNDLVLLPALTADSSHAASRRCFGCDDSTKVIARLNAARSAASTRGARSSTVGRELQHRWPSLLAHCRATPRIVVTSIDCILTCS